MKKLLITMILFSSVLILTAQPGRVKIYFNGFVCDRETWDDALQADGKGDEIFLTFQVSVTDINGNTKLTFDYKTPVYGDANGAFSNRVSAGSCVDLFGGAKGGIKGGDRYLTSDLIFEFDITSTDIVSIIPVIWEWDPGQDVVNPILSRLKSATAELSRETAKFFGSPEGTFSPEVNTIGDISKIIFPITAFLHPNLYSFLQSIIGQQGTRPIGIPANGDFSPKVMVLSPLRMTSNSNMNIGYGQGIIPVKYFETELGNERDHGNYLVLMRTEFTPSQTSIASGTPPPPPSTSTSTTTNVSTATQINRQITIPAQTVTYPTAPVTTTTSQPVTTTSISNTSVNTTNTSTAVPSTTTTTGKKGSSGNGTTSTGTSTTSKASPKTTGRK